MEKVTDSKERAEGKFHINYLNAGQFYIFFIVNCFCFFSELTDPNIKTKYNKGFFKYGIWAFLIHDLLLMKHNFWLHRV